MAKKSGNLKREDIKEELKLIEGSKTDYISPLGNVYKLTYNGLFLKKKPYINQHNGYVYVGITMLDGKNKNHRLHRLIAKSYIPNPKNYSVVGHKNNIKHDNRLSNLYWTTVQENTQKAYDDGLAINDKGYDDSQSHPVIVYDLNMNEIFRFGSITECSKTLKVGKTTISNHCKYGIKTKPSCGYYFKYQN